MKQLEDFHKSGGTGLRRVCIACVTKERNIEYHQRERPCSICGKIKTSFQYHSRVCADCFGKYKRCPRCGEVKELTDFGSDAADPFRGLQSNCRKCQLEYDRERAAIAPKRCTLCGEHKDKSAFEHLGDRFCIDCRKARVTYRCSACGIEKPLEKFGYDIKMPLHKSNRCRACLAEKARQTMATITSRYTAAKQLAKKTGRNFSIPFEEYAELRSQPCHYCGHELNATGSGLDRINPLGHYTPDNVVPCCKQCNMAKSDVFTYDEMLVIGEAIGRVKAKRCEHETQQTPITPESTTVE